MTEPTTEARFWSKVLVPRDPAGCWPWTGWASPEGYGRFLLDGRNSGYTMAHHYSWTLMNGPVPDGLQVLHRCDNPPCVNPEHLFLGTNADNVADRDRKGRAAPMTSERGKAMRARVRTSRTGRPL